MPISTSTATFLFFFIVFVVAAAASASSGEELVAELESLRSQSPSGVIHLDDRLVSRFLKSAAAPRSYFLVIFFEAAKFRNKPELHLPHLRNEFALISSSYAAHHKDDDAPRSPRLFFCDIEFGESERSFTLFGVRSVPHLLIVPPSARSLREDSIPMDHAVFPGGAEAMVDFVETKANIAFGGPLLRPPPMSARQVLLLLAAILISAPFLVRRLLAGDTFMHDYRFWMAVTLFVYIFGVSGTMHNIIRKMPLFLPDHGNPDRFIYFFHGSGMQLGAECFAVGLLYMTVGLMLAFATHGVVKLRSVAAQRGVMIGGMLVVYWAVGKVISLDNWKTGYRIHAFWPKSWR